MFCEMCGKPNDDDAAFCEYCGAPLSDDETDDEINDEIDNEPEQEAEPIVTASAAPEPEPEPELEPEPEPEPEQESEPAPVPAPKPAAAVAAAAPQKKSRGAMVAVIVSVAVAIAAVIMLVIVLMQNKTGSSDMTINGKNIPVEIAMFDTQSGSAALTANFCGKNNKGAYICTVTFNETPQSNTDYSSGGASVSVIYSGKDTKVNNDYHQYAYLSSETTQISVGEYVPNSSIEITVSGKTNPDVFGDFDGVLEFKVNTKAEFSNDLANTLAEWKSSGMIPA